MNEHPKFKPGDLVKIKPENQSWAGKSLHIIIEYKGLYYGDKLIFKAWRIDYRDIVYIYEDTIEMCV